MLGLTERPEERANAELLARQGVEILPGSITDGELCERAMRGVSHVFHLAVAMREGGKSDEFFEAVNLDGTRRSARGRGRREASSGSSTAARSGSTATAPRASPPRTSPLRPGNIYERTKVAAERLVRELAPAAGVPFTILRPADVYGPRDQRLLKLFKGVSAGRFPLFGSGTGRRHMVYVDDVVAAFFQACERREAVGEAMIVAGPRPCTLRELIEEVRRATGSPRFGRRLPLAPMLATAAVVEDVCQALHLDPPIYRRRMDFFTSDSEFDTSRARRRARLGAARGPRRKECGEQTRATGGRGAGISHCMMRAYHSWQPSSDWRFSRDRALAAPALPPLAQEAADRGRPAGAPAAGRGPALSRAGLRHGPHLALPARARRHLGERRFRAGPRPLRQGSWWATGCSRSASASCRSGPPPFDLVAAINFLEHIKDDETFFAEMVRVLKPGGDFLFMAPKGEPRPARVRAQAGCSGFTADQEGFGHARDGYPLPAARALMERHGLAVRGQRDYCRFFTESLEDLLNYAYHRKAMQGKDTAEQDFHGDTAPMSADALNKVGTAYKVYSAVYPALRAWTLLDHLIPFSEGYMMVAWGRKAA